jgi:hypothetical protein
MNFFLVKEIQRCERGVRLHQVQGQGNRAKGSQGTTSTSCALCIN